MAWCRASLPTQFNPYAFPKHTKRNAIPARGQPPTEDRFAIPRARRRAAIDHGVIGGALELDANTVDGPVARLVEAEVSARWRAPEAGAPPYVVHLTNAGALEAVRGARARGKPVYAETCVQYFHFTKDNLNATAEDAFNGAKWVCSPPFRETSDQAALMRGIRTGDLVSVSTDHCPFNYKTQKTLGANSFAAIPNGVPGIEDRRYRLWDAAVRTGQKARFDEKTQEVMAGGKVFHL